MSTLTGVLAERAVVLDGGLATELEQRGHALADELWSARLLRDDPQAVLDAHRAFVEAGAEIATSASYQASYEALGDDTEVLLRRSVALARASGARWVAASVGPYGAMLADGAEYRGDYGLSTARLRVWHRRRLATLAEAGADVLAIETIPCLAEVDALVHELDTLAVPAWVSVTCSGDRLRHGEPAVEAFALAASCPAVIAVGVNCTDPRDVAQLSRLAASAGGKPVITYPNSGETWDPVARGWVGRPGLAPEDVSSWLAAGARLVGGCCRVRPADIAAIAAIAATVR